jgi:hypothetical protein
VAASATQQASAQRDVGFPRFSATGDAGLSFITITGHHWRQKQSAHQRQMLLMDNVSHVPETTHQV